jgi:hypothetical protein
MTKEDAKDYIREWCPYDKQDEIIKALEQEPCKDDTWSISEVAGALERHGLITREPCEDAISRDDALKIFDDFEEDIENDMSMAYTYNRARLEELPSVSVAEKVGAVERLFRRWICRMSLLRQFNNV